MIKKWIVINLLLLAAAIWLGRYVYNSVMDYKNANLDIPKASDDKTVQAAVLPPAEERRLANTPEFKVVIEKFVFSENRTNIEPKDPTPPKVEIVDNVQALTQKPILVGTIISDTKQPLALIIDPTAGGAARGAPPGAAGPEGIMPGAPPAQAVNRRAQLKRVGDTYQGYIITSITADSIVLKAGTRTETIPLHEGSKGKKPSGKTPVVATKVINIGGTGGGTSGSGSTAGGTAARGTAAAGSPAAAAGGASGANPGGRGGATSSPATTPPTPVPTITPATPTGRPFNVVGEAPTPVRTPFGDVVTRP